MFKVFGRYSAHTFAILRVIAGLMFAMHGTQKLLGFPPSGAPAHAGGPPPMILASGVIELVCGLLIAIGLFCSLAAFIASGEMAVAYFMAHAHGSFWPIQNKGELAILYCFLFLVIAAHGAGNWSIDSVLHRRAPVTTV